MSKKVLPRCWYVSRDVSLERLLSWCLEVRKVDRLLLATRLDRDAREPTLLEPAVENVVRDLFGDRLMETVPATAWPGTQLIGHAGRLYVIDFDRSVIQRIVDAENRLGAWTQWHQPPLPEDLCLYRIGDPAPVLVSVTHDGDAWIFHDGDVSAEMAVPASIVLPAELIPPAPDFFVARKGTR